MSDPWFVDQPTPPRRCGASRKLGSLLVLVCVGSAVYHLDPVGRAAYAVTRGKLQAEREYLSSVSPEHVAHLDQVSTAYHLVAEVIKPSVVSIRSSKSAANDEEMPARLRNFLGGAPRMSTNVGAGVIFNKDGLIVTSNHVVDGADDVSVELADGRSFEATIVNNDPQTDLALLKINADRLHPATFGDSDAVDVGHVVMAVGSPFRLSQTVSHGIISAKGRRDVGLRIDYQDFLQTDCAINPGNSGGPLVNTRGQVIGINTAIATDSGTFSGIGFATPSNKVVEIANTLKSGHVVRGFLGVAIGSLTDELAERIGLEAGTQGVIIGDLSEDGPAAKSGLRADDVVLKIEGKAVHDTNALQDMVAATKPGTKRTFSVWRDGKQIELKVTIGQQPKNFSIRGGLPQLRRENRKDDGYDPGPAILIETLGAEVRPATAELLSKYGLDDAKPGTGLIITSVKPTGLAHTLELTPGTLIVSADKKRVSSPDELQRILTVSALEEGVRMRTIDSNGTHNILLQTK